MVVNFTPNVGLAKPTQSEIAEKWVNIDQLQDDNLDIIAAQMNITLQTSIPALVATTVNPNLGVGTSKMEYIDCRGIIMGQFVIEFTDPGVAAGTGEYGISLPQTVNGLFHSVGTALNQTPGPYSVIGNGFLQDASSVATSGACALDCVTVGGVSYLRMITEVFTAPAKTARFMTNAQPFTPATGDVLTGFFIYKKS